MRTYKFDKEQTVEEFIINSLDGADYERGALETAAHQATNTTEALARLVSLLTTQGLLTESQVAYIALGYIPEEYK